jgi:hypothetical protein
MPSSKSDVAEVRAALRAVGYTVLQVQPRVEGLSGFGPDVLAWASNADGELVPWAVVECKNKKLMQPELVLPALEGSRDLLSTIEHYAVVNGQWFKADRGLRSLEPVDGPTTPEHGSQGLVTDRSLATSLLLQRLWFEADRLRNSGVADRHFPSGDVLTPPRDRGPGIELPDGALTAKAGSEQVEPAALNSPPEGDRVEDAGCDEGRGRVDARGGGRWVTARSVRSQAGYCGAARPRGSRCRRTPVAEAVRRRRAGQ